MKKIMTALMIALALPALGDVTGTETRVEYVADGVDLDFDFTFKTVNPTHIEVYVAGVKQTSGYAVALNGGGIGGTVTFVAPPANAAVVRIQRLTPRKQETVLEPHSPFKAKTVERMADNTVVIVQEVERRVIDAEVTQAGMLAAQDARDDAQDSALTSTNTSIRTDFAAEDAAIRSEVGAADAAIRSDYAAADASIRTDFALADTSIRTDQDARDDAQDASIQIAVGGEAVTTAPTFTATAGSGSNGFVLQNGAKVCFDGTGCTKGVRFDGVSLTLGSSPLWHAGNDGAASGADADKLDDLDSTAFAPNDHTHPLRSIGWMSTYQTGEHTYGGVADHVGIGAYTWAPYTSTITSVGDDIVQGANPFRLKALTPGTYLLRGGAFIQGPPAVVNFNLAMNLTRGGTTYTGAGVALGFTGASNSGHVTIEQIANVQAGDEYELAVKEAEAGTYYVGNPYFTMEKLISTTITPTAVWALSSWDSRGYGHAQGSTYGSQLSLVPTYWITSAGAVGANTLANPVNGAVDADFFQINSTAGPSYVGQNTLAAGAATISIYAKPNTITWLRIMAESTPTTRFADFNLTTGAIGTVGSNVWDVRNTDAGNGWRRISMSIVPSSTMVRFVMLEGNNDPVFSSTGGLVHLWGAQSEAGALGPWIGDVGGLPWQANKRVPQIEHKVTPRSGAWCVTTQFTPHYYWNENGQRQFIQFSQAGSTQDDSINSIRLLQFQNTNKFAVNIRNNAGANATFTADVYPEAVKTKRRVSLCRAGNTATEADYPKLYINGSLVPWTTVTTPENSVVGGTAEHDLVLGPVYNYNAAYEGVYQNVKTCIGSADPTTCF